MMHCSVNLVAGFENESTAQVNIIANMTFHIANHIITFSCRERCANANERNQAAAAMNCVEVSGGLIYRRRRAVRRFDGV
jgi:hypothetical protein